MTTYNAGDYTNGGLKRPCLLDEGNVTVGTAYGIGGGSAKTYSFASEIKKGMVVAVSTDTGNTWANTNGSILVNQVANGTDLVIGIVISEPEWTKKPASTTAADSLAKRLAAKTLRAATVWFPNLTAMTKATLNCANGANVVPGTLSILKLDVSACNADGGIFVNDVASGGTINAVSMHYQAQDSGSTVVVPIMLAFFGGKFVAAT
jgi:hypothetical protein